MYYLPFLSEVHRILKPRAYLEVGVAEGKSLALSRCRSVGIDPSFLIRRELDNDIALVKTTSDEYFSRPDPLALTKGQPFDLAFLDGLHLFEFAFRDFIYAERYSSPRAVIVFDDMLPRTVDEAARDRHTDAWAGDVYPMLEVLARYRPDLVVVPVDTAPTGLLFVFGLDPESTVLSDHYDEIIANFRVSDPQPVPDDLLDRMAVFKPRRLLDSGVLDFLGGLGTEEKPDEIRARLQPLVQKALGSDYVKV